MTRLPDYAVLEEVGLTLYERKALIALMVFGVADAAALCREGGVPTSKIYLAMEKLAGLGLAQIQPTRPKLFASLPPDTVADRVIEIARERAERFATRAPDLRELLLSLPGRVRERGVHPGPGQLLPVGATKRSRLTRSGRPCPG